MSGTSDCSDAQFGAFLKSIKNVEVSTSKQFRFKKATDDRPSTSLNCNNTEKKFIATTTKQNPNSSKSGNVDKINNTSKKKGNDNPSISKYFVIGSGSRLTSDKLPTSTVKPTCINQSSNSKKQELNHSAKIPHTSIKKTVKSQNVTDMIHHSHYSASGTKNNMNKTNSNVSKSIKSYIVQNKLTSTVTEPKCSQLHRRINEKSEETSKLNKTAPADLKQSKQTKFNFKKLNIDTPKSLSLFKYVEIGTPDKKSGISDECTNQKNVSLQDKSNILSSPKTKSRFENDSKSIVRENGKSDLSSENGRKKFSFKKPDSTTESPKINKIHPSSKTSPIKIDHNTNADCNELFETSRKSPVLSSNNEMVSIRKRYAFKKLNSSNLLLSTSQEMKNETSMLNVSQETVSKPNKKVDIFDTASPKKNYFAESYGSGTNSIIHDSLDRVSLPETSRKKFTFKKSNSSSTFLNISQKSDNSDLNNSPLKKQPDSFNNFNLDNEIMEISDSLNACPDDYMDDIEFERTFGIKSNASTTNKKSEYSNSSKSDPFMDDLNLGDINWDDQVIESAKSEPNEVLDISDDIDFNDDCFAELNAEEISTNQWSRKDDSKEFKKLFPHSEVMKEVLHERFGLRTYRPHQQEICNASLTGHDCFVLMPTGGGKSLCYQLPATLTFGVTIVISPLRALISDQVDKLNALDIPSAHLCADLDKQSTELVFSKLYMREPEIKLLYLTPEKICASKNCSDAIESLYKRDKLARFVIDECHCLSQWGHDFRPDYKELSSLRRKFPKVPIICLTATATKHVEEDVISILKLRNVKTFIRSFNRPNIKYKIIKKSGKAAATEEMGRLLKQNFFKKSGIIYCLSRDDCSTLASDLTKMGIKSKAYHAGLSSKIRDEVQRAWMQDQFYVIVGTIAFGMGIDKPDVRFVIHNTVPKSVEAFYQESGRAGRDGELSYSYLFYSYVDVKRLQRIMSLEKTNKKTLEGHFENLRQMVAYCENVVDCRRYLQLIHLGENFDRRICINNKKSICDNCESSNKYKSMEVTANAKEIGQLVSDLASREDITMMHVAEVYKGSKAKRLLERGHHKHPLYGKGANFDRADIQRILMQLMLKNMIREECVCKGEFPQVYIKPGVKFSAINSPNFTLSISVNKSGVAEDKTAKSTAGFVKAANLVPCNNPSSSSSASVADFDTPSVSKPVKPKPTISKYDLGKIQVECHEELLEECRRLAMEKNVTLSSIMNLSAIKSMSDVLPNNKEDFMKIQHVTKANYDKYGEHFLKITSKHRAIVEAQTKKVAKEKAPEKTPANSFVDDDDWWYDGSQPSGQGSGGGGVKRKSTGFGGGGVKRFKKSFGRKKKGAGKWKSKAKKTSPKAKKSPKGKKRTGAANGKLNLMPVLHLK